jgi:putative transposase
MDQDKDFQQESVRIMSQKPMELEVEQQTGVARHERTPERKTQRSGYYYPSLLKPRRRAEQVLLAVGEHAYVEGVSIHKVDELLQAMGLTGFDKSAFWGPARRWTK